MYTIIIWLKKYIIPIIMILCITGSTYSQSSENYSIKKDVVDMAGGSAVSTNYQVNMAVGEASGTGSSESDAYQVNSGFFADQVVVTSVEEQELDALPSKFELYQNYPNPFNPETTIEFDVKESCDVSLILYDLLGREVAVLTDENYDPGAYTVTLEASTLPTGTYIYRIQMGMYRAVRKMVLLK
ncbi:T9SS type A sorting domain-containing protein [candidate division KSB1 bacterium]|nr:T9SS type A sorting domain-containing protein [candidate division KSB1 bacterium]